MNKNLICIIFLFFLCFFYKSFGEEGVKMDKIEYSGWKNCIRLKNDSIELIATTDIGPRVIRLGFIGGQNLFKEFPGDAGKTGGENWRSYGGHRLWHAPEVSPRTYEPDNDPVPYTWNGNTLKLSPHVEKGTGIQKEIEITLNQKENHVTMVHKLINRNPWDIECAAWCLSVMAPEGCAIFPQEEFRPHSEYLLPARPLVLWHYTDMKDPRWIWGTRYIQLKQDPTANTQQKAGMLNKKGWAAYHLKGEIFLKCYDYDPKASYPDFGCNTETYTASNMLEVETLSPFEKIPANGGILEYTEHWFLFKTKLDEKEETIDQNLLPLIKKAKELIH